MKTCIPDTVRIFFAGFEFFFFFRQIRQIALNKSLFGDDKMGFIKIQKYTWYNTFHTHWLDDSNEKMSSTRIIIALNFSGHTHTDREREERDKEGW